MGDPGRHGGRSGAWVLLFLAACVLFNWPVVTLGGGGVRLFAYLFLGGLAFVLLVFAVARLAGQDERSDG